MNIMNTETIKQITTFKHTCMHSPFNKILHNNDYKKRKKKVKYEEIFKYHQYQIIFFLNRYLIKQITGR